MNRKLFLTSGAACFVGLCISPLSSMAISTTGIQSTDKSFLTILEQLEACSLQSMSTSFKQAYVLFLKQLNTKNYQINTNKIYQLNNVSSVMPVIKSSFITKRNYLVLFVKSRDSFVSHILDNNMVSAYDEAITNYEYGSKSMNLDLDVLKFIAPTKVLEHTKRSDREQFIFQNSYGNTLTLITTSKKKYMTVC